MNLRQACLEMIRAYQGGWDAMATALGFSRYALQNRIYETKGQRLHVETALMMQEISGTTHFAEAIAALSGGVFVKIAQGDQVDRDDLHAKFQELYTELGQLSSEYSVAIGDNTINKKERAKLERIADDIHKTVQELMTLMFSVYCKREKTKADA